MKSTLLLAVVILCICLGGALIAIIIIERPLSPRWVIGVKAGDEWVVRVQDTVFGQYLRHFQVTGVNGYRINASFYDTNWGTNETLNYTIDLTRYFIRNSSKLLLDEFYGAVGLWVPDVIPGNTELGDYLGTVSTSPTESSDLYVSETRTIVFQDSSWVRGWNITREVNFAYALTNPNSITSGYAKEYAFDRDTGICVYISDLTVNLNETLVFMHLR
jgi:hypothetical protein